jgi:hypothetical protein
MKEEKEEREKERLYSQMKGEVSGVSWFEHPLLPID